SSSPPHLPPPASSTLSLHDALPICPVDGAPRLVPEAHEFASRHPLDDAHVVGAAAGEALEADAALQIGPASRDALAPEPALNDRSEEHTSELQSRGHLVCRLLLEKK